ncbi:MAG: hypothetical protein WBL74_12225 [Novosphingobium sp.]|uniref:hypothetical protein n=1 Tax=Novosphingobium sp. TaxID=1874826 RepID=UPI003C7B2D62
MLAAATALASNLPQFSFGPHRAGVAYTSESISTLDCKRDGAEIICIDNSANVGGTWAIVQIEIVNKRLSRLLVAGDRSSVPAVLSAMKVKYGQPC